MSSDLQRAKARAMVELLSYVEASFEDFINLFYAKDCCNMDQSRLVEFGHNIRQVLSKLFLLILNIWEFKINQTVTRESMPFPKPF